MKTADYTVHKPVPWWVIQVKWLKKTKEQKNILLTFKWQKKPWHIVGLIYRMSENAPKEGETDKGKDGSFFFNVSQCWKMSVTVKPSALPPPCRKMSIIYVWFFFFLECKDFFFRLHLNDGLRKPNSSYIIMYLRIIRLKFSHCHQIPWKPTNTPWIYSQAAHLLSTTQNTSLLHRVACFFITTNTLWFHMTLTHTLSCWQQLIVFMYWPCF